MVGSRPEGGWMPPKFSISNILVGPCGEEFFKGFVHRSYPKGGSSPPATAVRTASSWS
jgi:hypothetical protein